MTTKRSVVPFTQMVPLFTERGLVGAGGIWKEIEPGSSIQSNEIFNASEHPYGTLTFAVIPNPGGNPVVLEVKIKYRIKDTDIYTDEILISSLETTEPTGAAWRLDAKLGVNWMPNTPYKIIFKEIGGQNGAQIKGHAGV